LFGGWAAIQSVPGEGTTIIAELPIVEAHVEAEET
jgi:hypothetical protein